MRTPPRLLALLPAALLTVALGAGPAVADERPVPGAGTVAAAGAPPLPTTLTGTSWLVADMDTGEILAAKDAHHRLLPASTLKVLTSLALIPRLDKYATAAPTFNDVNVDGSRVGLVEKVNYPIYQLFRALLMTSGNDAANTLASAVGGQAAAARLMNDEARRVRADDTYAVNPSGLDAPGQLSTAYDLALIGRAAMKLPDFRDYVKTKNSSIIGTMGKPLAIATHDKLLWNYDGAIGIKNGYTAAAGATYIGAATRGGHTLIVTEMHAQPRIWPELVALLDWGFAAQKAGVTPIGRLQDPVDVTRQADGAAQRARIQPAAAHTTNRQDVVPLPLTVAAAGLLAAAATVVRRRRARRSRRSHRIGLPRF
jgi:D-alanyl-D-alanine carboxypeptidase (penicillin-binding protein 5/6)